MNRQRVLDETRSWPDVASHFARDRKLLIRPLGEQSDHQIFQSNHTDTKMDQFGIRQFRNLSSPLGMEGFCCVFIVPFRKRHLELLRNN